MRPTRDASEDSDRHHVIMLEVQASMRPTRDASEDEGVTMIRFDRYISFNEADA